MGKYSSINADNMYNNVVSCLEKIDEGSEKTALSDLKNIQMISTSPGNVAKSKLNTVINTSDVNGSILLLKARLNKLKSAASKIKSYKSVEDEIENLEVEARSLPPDQRAEITEKINRKRDIQINYKNEIDSILS